MDGIRRGVFPLFREETLGRHLPLGLIDLVRLVFLGAFHFGYAVVDLVGRILSGVFFGLALRLVDRIEGGGWRRTR